MEYIISALRSSEDKEDGVAERYAIDYTFHHQSARVTLTFFEDEPDRARLVSETDGYHWLQFFLSQEPGTDKLLERDYGTEVGLCQALFSPLGLGYEQEDKESAFITYPMSLNKRTLVEMVADIIGPRFANREHFF